MAGLSRLRRAHEASGRASAVECKSAEVVLDPPQEMVGPRLMALPRRRHVSDPWYVGFGWKHGLAGSQGSPLGLAPMLGAGISCLATGVEPGDSTSDTMIDVHDHIGEGAVEPAEEPVLGGGKEAGMVA